ncbi:MAG TPA: PfkB family carbohydrate kinase [Gemmatimonadaceae bacterium]|nr:PfkB family carbohydrate kinase [Gemmatimonadaceae bacterium]HRQ79374.1 PfkB family carbohydrate kinase [Gemmatimonadaceae bacterium]
MPKSRLSRDRLQQLLGAITNTPPRIAVVGDAMLDLYLKGEVERISPEAPVPVVRVRERKYALGGAANVAQNALAVGARCELVAAVGRDAAGAQLREMLAAQGAEPRGLVDCDRPTTTKTRVVARNQQVVRVDEEVDADLSGDEVTRVLDAVARAVAGADALILEDYNKGVLVPQVIRAAIDAARAKRIPVVVDPKFRNFFEYRGCTVFKPNRRELEGALGAAVDVGNPDALPDVLARLDAAHLLLTLSERGMALVSRGAEDEGGARSEGKERGARGRPEGGGERRGGATRVERIPTTAREVFDVVGAGDTVTAYLAAILAVGGSALEASIVANYAAGIQVGKAGAAVVTPAEVLAAYDDA